jgi:hypothetical protein
MDPLITGYTEVHRGKPETLRVHRAAILILPRGRILVRPERFELPTCCSGGDHSIQLSYGRVVNTVYMGEQRSSNAEGSACGQE